MKYFLLLLLLCGTLFSATQRADQQRYWGGHPPQVLGDGKTVVLTSYGGRIWWLRDGKKIAEYKIVENVDRIHVLADGKSVVVIGRRALYWLQEGKRVNFYNTGDDIDSSLLLKDGQTVVVYSYPIGMKWIRNGKKISETAVGGWPHLGQRVLLPDGETIVVACEQHKLCWFRNGQSIAEFELAAGEWIGFFSVLADGKTIVLPTSVSRRIYWLNEGLKVAQADWTDNRTFHVSTTLRDGKTVLLFGAAWEGLSWFQDGKEIFNFDPGFMVNTGMYGPELLGDGRTAVILGQTSGYHEEIFWVRDGVKIYGLDVGNNDRALGPVLGDGKTLTTYPRNVGVADKNIYWIRNGKKIAQVEIEEQNLQTPTVLADGQTMVFATFYNVYWYRQGKKVAEYKF